MPREWRCADGREIPVARMTTRHIQNALWWVKNKQSYELGHALRRQYWIERFTTELNKRGVKR